MGQRGPRPKGEQEWYRGVAELMVNELMSFSAACQAMGQRFTRAEDEHVHEYSPAFRNLLTGMHIDYFVEIGQNPSIGKEYVKGVAVKTIGKLAEQDQWDKVTVPLKELADVLGLTKETEDRPVLANLTQAEVDAVRLKMKQVEEAQKQIEQAEGTQVRVVVVPGGDPN